jgi:hypothetical protein
LFVCSFFGPLDRGRSTDIHTNLLELKRRERRER